MFLFTNAKIFDGVNDQLIENGFVLVEGDEIREISGSPIKTEKAEIIDCEGHFLMPGLIDNHFHVYSVTFDMQWLDRNPFRVVKPFKLDKKRQRYCFTDNDITMIMHNSEKFYDFYYFM